MTTGKREGRPKASERADQLRPLNLPRPINVALDEDGLPAAVGELCPSTPLPPCPSDNGDERITTTENAIAEKAVEAIIEIWHVDDEWWREPISRRCVEVILEGGKHVVDTLIRIEFGREIATTRRPRFCAWRTRTTCMVDPSYLCRPCEPYRSWHGSSSIWDTTE